MTAPVMPPQQAAPPQPMAPPPQPPPSPFPVRANDQEPLVAGIYVKRLSKLMVDPKFTAMQEQFPEWATTVVEAYQRYMQVVIAAQPPMPLPKGVVITDKVAGGNIGAEENAATHPNQPQPQQPKQAQPAKPPQMPRPAGAHP